LTKGLVRSGPDLFSVKSAKHRAEKLLMPQKNFKKNVLVNVKEKLQKIINNINFIIIFKEVSLIKGIKSGKPQIIESYII
jgi:hypothetical protein